MMSVLNTQLLVSVFITDAVNRRVALVARLETAPSAVAGSLMPLQWELHPDGNPAEQACQNILSSLGLMFLPDKLHLVKVPLVDGHHMFAVDARELPGGIVPPLQTSDDRITMVSLDSIDHLPVDTQYKIAARHAVQVIGSRAVLESAVEVPAV